MSVSQDKVVLDAARFSDLHHEYHDRLLNSMTGVVRDREAAEEITAAAFAKAFEKRASFRGESKPSSWLFKIALNEARQRLSRKGTVSLDALEFTPPALIAADRLGETSERSEQMRRLQKALGSLPEIYRQPLIDHFLHGYAMKQIARRNRIPLGTVLSRIHTAKQRLRAAWEA